MKITEAIENIKNNGNVYTDENLKDLEEAVLSQEFEDFKDPNLKEFLSFINILPFHEKIQEIISKLVMKMSEKGVEIPCGGGCSDECVFHESEFGN